MDQKSRATAETHPWLGHYPEGVDWAAPLPAQSLTEVFDAVVKEFHESLARAPEMAVAVAAIKVTIDVQRRPAHSLSTS